MATVVYEEVVSILNKSGIIPKLLIENIIRTSLHSIGHSSNTVNLEIMQEILCSSIFSKYCQ